jgi:hypothetical protein
MSKWLFQGNPLIFDMTTYIAENTNILWSVTKRKLAEVMLPGEDVVFWRASGRGHAIPGVIAHGVIVSVPKVQYDDPAALALWTQAAPRVQELRVPVRIVHRCTTPRSVVREEWIKEDPALADLPLLKMRNATNYRLSESHARRLLDLVRCTGRDWDEDESLAGLYAYVKTRGTPISKKAGGPVAEVALSTGRAVTGVYNKVMNFRSIDPNDGREGLAGAGEADRTVWKRYFNTKLNDVDEGQVVDAYVKRWGNPWPLGAPNKPAYKDFGPPPNDNPEDLQTFARKVRRGQAKFRTALRALYNDTCAISGWSGPENVMEAAHIQLHSSTGLNSVENGLLIRADLHSLFDDHLLRIDPKTLKVVLHDSLRNTEYWELNGKALEPREGGSTPSLECLKVRWEECPLKLRG